MFLVRDYHRAHLGDLGVTTTKGAIWNHMAGWVDGVPLEVRRIALNRDQVERYQPPPNPAKVTDSRFEGYRREHGEESWELDALEPQVLDRLIEGHLEAEKDEEEWAISVAREEANQAALVQLAETWDGGQSRTDPRARRALPPAVD